LFTYAEPLFHLIRNFLFEDSTHAELIPLYFDYLLMSVANYRATVVLRGKFEMRLADGERKMWQKWWCLSV